MSDHCESGNQLVALDMRVETNKTLFVGTECGSDPSALENLEKCKKWLEKCALSDDKSICSEGSNADGSSTTDCSSECSSQMVSLSNKLNTTDNSMMDNQQLQTIIGENKNVYENIIVNNSKKVHLGNIMVINGPIYLKERKDPKNTDEANETYEIPEHHKIAEARIRWIDRRAWLSQPPVAEYKKLERPAKYVIISHSATEDSTSHAENVLLVRFIQQFHIESREWIDVAYNFMIGCDGYTYKGRGWGVYGSHSFRYNAISVGICFVGTFCAKLPTQIALEQAQALIRYGVEQGEIDADYSLIGHCQVSSTRSPGACLFAEIQTWDHYDASVSLEHPSPLIEDI